MQGRRTTPPSYLSRLAFRYVTYLHWFFFFLTYVKVLNIFIFFQYMDLLKSVKNATTVIPTMITFILSFYQMAYLKHLPSIILRVKIVLEFFFLVLAVAHFTTQSEKMNSCQITLCRALCQNKWYLCSSRTRRDLCFILRVVQRPRHFSFLNGLVVCTMGILLRITRASFSFINWMTITGKL